MLTLRPYSELGRSGVWDHFFNDTVSRFIENAERDLSRHTLAPAVDIYETADALVFDIELPGFERNQIDINIEEGLLSITAERLFNENAKNFQRRERSYGKFHRRFRLPPFADSEKVLANLKNGVLSVTVPKREEAKSRQIEVQG